MTSEEYQEINLVNYIRVIIKNWKAILIITIVCILLCFCLIQSSVSNPVYQVKSIIQIGSVQNELLESKSKLIATLLTIKTAEDALIAAGYQNVTQSQAQALISSLEIDGLNPKNQPYPDNLLEITMRHQDIGYAMQIVTAFRNLIIERHKILFNDQKVYRDQVTKNLGEKKRLLENKLNTFEENISKLSELRYPASYAPALAESLPAYLTLQEKLQAEIFDLQAEIDTQKMQQKYDSLTRVFSPPIKPDEPIPAIISTKLTVIISTILGLFIGLISVLFLKWWQINKSALHDA